MRRTIGEWLFFFCERGGNIRELRWLLAEGEGGKRGEFLDPFHYFSSQEHESWFCEGAERLVAGEPLAYVLGFVEFLSCRIETTPHALIPRQETEILVEALCGQLQSQKGRLSQHVLWDICCGSGCIGIAIKKRFPALRVIASDVSADALELAEKNAVANNVEVEFRKGDLLEPFEGEKAHYLVCNPPYLSMQEYEQLDLSVKQFEPKQALIGGETGMLFYERLAGEGHRFLQPVGRLWLEMGSSQGKRIQQLFTTSPWLHGRLWQDWAGWDRFFSVERE